MEPPQTPPPFNFMGINGQCVPNSVERQSDKRACHRQPRTPKTPRLPRASKRTPRASRMPSVSTENQEHQERQSRFATPIYARPLFKTPCMLAIHFNPHSTEYFLCKRHIPTKNTATPTPKPPNTLKYPKSPIFARQTPNGGKAPPTPPNTPKMPLKRKIQG